MSEDQKPPFFRGEWIVADDERYDEARLRIFNTRRDPHPPVVARCLGNADVIAALAVARDRGYEVAVRSAGWNLEGFSATDGLTIDLSLMRGVRVDPRNRTAWIQGGVTSGDLQVEADRYNLAGVISLFSGNGMGFVLGGGVGHLARRAGYSCDNVLAVELVTAAGEVVVASPEENPDLFWAVRGTQGNFGVVTGLRVQLHEVPEQVLAGELSWGTERIADALRAIADAAEWATDEFNLLSFHEPGKSSIWVCHSGAPDVAESEVARLVESAAPDGTSVRPISFRDLTFARDDQYAPARVSLDHEIQTAELDDDFVKAIQTRMTEPDPGSGYGARLIEIHPIFRAMSRAPIHPSAAHDGAVTPHWAVVPIAAWGDAGEDDAYERWVLESVSALRSAAADSGHLLDCFGTNAMGSAAAAFGTALPRLRELKREWDPDNVFRANLNIEPAAV